MRIPIVLSLALVLFAGCDEPPSYTDGSKAFAEEQADALSKVWTIGEREEDVFEGAALHRVRDVAIAPDGRLFVSDGGNLRILTFDENGQWQGRFGQEGEGPGEFVALSKLDIEGDTLYVLDTRPRRISVFDMEGDFIRSFPIKEMGADVAVREDHLYLSFFSPIAKENLVSVYATGGQRGEPFGTPLPSTVEVNRAGEAGHLALAEEAIYYAFAYPYRMERYDTAGQWQQTIEIEHPAFAPPTSGDSHEGYQLGGELPAKIRGLAVTDAGTLVVQVIIDEQSPQLDFISPEGTLLQSLSLPPEHQLAAVDGEYLYTFVHGGDEAVASITKWRFRE